MNSLPESVVQARDVEEFTTLITDDCTSLSTAKVKVITYAVLACSYKVGLYNALKF